MPLHTNSLEFYFITPCTNNGDETEPENFMASHYLSYQEHFGPDKEVICPLLSQDQSSQIGGILIVVII